MKNIDFSHELITSGLIEQGVDLKTANKIALHLQDKHNQDLFLEFSRRCLIEIDKGIYRVGAKGIMEDMRRNPEIARYGHFKISNSYTAYYQRVFIIFHKEHRNRFLFKQTKGLKSNFETNQQSLLGGNN
jgi:hypothetical protein